MLDIFSFSNQTAKISLEEYRSSQYISLGHFTSSILLNDIQKNGFLPPIITNKYSNDDMLSDGDENFIYFTSLFDNTYSKNAIRKFGGEEVLIIVKLNRFILELDDLNQKFSRKNIDLKDEEKLYNELVVASNVFDSKCRTKKQVHKDNILQVYKVNELLNNKKFIEIKRSNNYISHLQIDKILKK